MDLNAVLLTVIALVAGAGLGAVAGFSVARARSAGAVAALSTAVTERDMAREQRDEARTSAVRLEERLAAEQSAAAEKLALLTEAQQQLRESFRALSAEALEHSNRQFLALADTRFKEAGARATGELEQKRQAVEHLVGPLRETLAKVEGQLQEVEKSRAATFATLTEQIDAIRLTGDQLRQETTALVGALRKPQARGRWGELQLRRAVELAGMTDRCDFLEQESYASSDGLQRPDLVVRLVGGKSVVVDSKVTLAAYLEAYEATDDQVREQRLDAHARHLRQHVDALAAKAYWEQLSPAPEFVVLFVPGDAFLAPALDRDRDLLEHAFTKRVHIATPTTLISLLRTVAYGWQQEALAANAREVFDLGRELYKRLGTLGGHVDKLGRALTSAVSAYNGTVGSFERQVLVTARKLNSLEVVDDDLDTPRAVEEPVRSLSAAELVSDAELSRAVRVLPPAAEIVLAGPPEQGALGTG